MGSYVWDARVEAAKAVGDDFAEEAAATLAPLLGLAHRIVQLEVLTLAHTLLDPLDRLQAARGV